MHRRKRFLIYPRDYKPGDGFVIRYSRLQAWKVAARMGSGASVDMEINIHPARGKFWNSSQLLSLWEPLTLRCMKETFSEI